MWNPIRRRRERREAHLLEREAFRAAKRLAREDLLVLGEDVTVSPSPGKGQGVFALRCIGDGALVSRYEGIVRTTDDSNRARVLGRTSNEYALNLDVDEAGNGWVVDAEFSERSGWQRYIMNHMPQNLKGHSLSQCFGVWLEWRC